jgi:hypothetical protein
MKITAGTQSRRVLAVLQDRTGEAFSFREVERFKAWWIDHTPEGTDTKDLNQSDFLSEIEDAGL